MNKREKLDAIILQWMDFELEEQEDAAIEAELKRHAGSRTLLSEVDDVIGLLKPGQLAIAA